MLLLVAWAVTCVCAFENRYTEEANTMDKLKDQEAPFRMGKLNMLWSKAVKVSAKRCTGRVLSAKRCAGRILNAKFHAVKIIVRLS